jgi:hypothetical protein
MSFYANEISGAPHFLAIKKNSGKRIENQDEEGNLQLMEMMARGGWAGGTGRTLLRD